MASIGGVSSNNMTSSLYNSANVISGLASGLDTEGMIEGLVKSYQTKIQNLNNKATKLEWKQEAYRSIINKMYAFGSKYTSYSSATNLMSASFFNSAIKVASMGANKDAVSASGRTESDIKLTSVKQLATSARYSTASSLKGISDDFSVEAEKAVNFSDEMLMGTLSGSLSLKYGGKTVSVVFDPNTDIIQDYELDENGKVKLDYDNNPIKRDPGEKAKDLADLINRKLEDAKVTLSNGETKAASDLIRVEADPFGRIAFSDKTTGGNDVYISGASGTVDSVLPGLNLDNASEDKPSVIQLTKETALTQKPTVADLISGQAMNVSLDGKTKTIQLPTIKKDSSFASGYGIVNDKGKLEELTGTSYADAVQAALDKEFGSGKITVTNESADGMKLKFRAQDNSDLVINSDAGKALGIGNVATNYLSTGKTLGDLMDDGVWSGLTAVKGEGEITEKDGKLVDKNGSLVNKDGNLIDKDGNELYAFKINGATIGNYGKGTKLSTIMSDINSNSEAGVKVSYSQTTRKFTFTSKDTGSENEIKLGGGLATAMFGSVDTSALGRVGSKDIMGTTDSMQGREFSLKIGGDTFSYTVGGSNPTVDQMLGALNGKLKSKGYTAELSERTGAFVIKDKDGNQVTPTEVNDNTKAFFDGLTNKAYAMADNVKPKTGYTDGQDAIFTAEINGSEPMVMKRGSNSFNLDGMTLTLKDTFNDEYVSQKDDGSYSIAEGAKPATEAVTFQRSTDSDKIVDAVKSMIADYNDMMSEIRTQYATLPYQNSNGSFQSYEPLTDEDKASMSESAIQKYEEKAKQGLLFNDNNLSTLYDRMRNVFTPGGADEALLRQMGITMSYSSADSSMALTLDESKLRSMLDSDPDAVADVFTRSSTAGGSSNGIMQSLKTQLDRYAGTTGATKGILVEQAGTPLSSLTLMNNAWQKQIDSIGDEIEKWQSKLTAQVDKYTSMFSKLETLIYQMNSQSSTLAGLMGG